MRSIFFLRTVCIVALTYDCAVCYKQYADIGAQNVVLLYYFSWSNESKSVTCTKDQMVIGECSGTLSSSCSLEPAHVGVYEVSSNAELSSLSLIVLYFNETTSGTYSCSKPNNIDMKTISLEKRPALHLTAIKAPNNSFVLSCTISTAVHKIHWFAHDGNKPPVTNMTQDSVNGLCKTEGKPESLECFCYSKMVYKCIVKDWNVDQTWGCYSDIMGNKIYSNTYRIPALYLDSFMTSNTTRLLVCTISTDVYEVIWFKKNGTLNDLVANQTYHKDTCNTRLEGGYDMKCFCNSTTQYTCEIKNAEEETHVWVCNAEINGTREYSNDTKGSSNNVIIIIAICIGGVGGGGFVTLSVSVVVIYEKRRKRNIQKLIRSSTALTQPIDSTRQNIDQLGIELNEISLTHKS